MLNINQRQLGIILTLAAALGFAGKTILAKIAYRYGVDALTLLTIRMTVAGLFFFTILFYNVFRKNWSLNLKPRQWLLVTVLGICGYYLSSFLDFSGLVYIDAYLGRMILFLYPTMVIIITAIISRTHISGQIWLALLICYLGITLMILPNFGQHQKNFWLGSTLVFFGALTYACYLVGVDRFFRSFAIARFISIIMCISSVFVFIHFLIARDITSLYLPIPVFVDALAMGLFCTVIPVYAISIGIALLGASKASMISMVGPIMTLIMGAIILDEKVSFIQIVGMIMIILGVSRIK